MVPTPHPARDEDGYELWLRYARVTSSAAHAAYLAAHTELVVCGDSPTRRVVAEELTRGLAGLLGAEIPLALTPSREGALVVGTLADAPEFAALAPALPAGEEAFLITPAIVGGVRAIAIVGRGERGMLYGAFRWLRHLGLEGTLEALPLSDAPRVALRVLNHWDNLDRTIERGYAGFSLWEWHHLPHHRSPRYRDYARVCASIGLNGAVLTNVNAKALVLTRPYLEKAAALADVLRPYGVRVYLTARFNAPIELAGLPTADPRDAEVIAFWRRKVDEIYALIPDFGGFVVKANSEGQPGPQDYGRTHADGANLLADAIGPERGSVFWRAFVYDAEVPDDRAKQAYDEFVPLDGRFRDNVLVQVKNGPIDFQPREPFHPLFGAMPQTPLALELQLTQEYLGQGTHLAYLAPLFAEVLAADTQRPGPGATVARVVDGSLDGHRVSAMVAVANTGNDRNWCGHPFAAANLYAFGRLCWDPAAAPATLADEWLRLTFTADPRFVEPARAMLLASRDAVVDYMTPLGLCHLMAWDHHYGPGPWVVGFRADWCSTYYHRADAAGLGFERTPRGSGATAQYAEPWQRLWNEIETCPEELLLWFHHVPWSHPMRSGRSLWEELCFRYQRGVDAVRGWQATWASLAPYVDGGRFEHVRSLLAVQEREACWWRDACVLYFQTFAQLPLPDGYEPASASLEALQSITHYFVPGIPERRV